MDENGILDDEKTKLIFLQEFEKDESEIIRTVKPTETYNKKEYYAANYWHELPGILRGEKVL